MEDLQNTRPSVGQLGTAQPLSQLNYLLRLQCVSTQLPREIITRNTSCDYFIHIFLMMPFKQLLSQMYKII